MEENYFTTMRRFGELYNRHEMLRHVECELDSDRFESWVKDDPLLDIARQNAKSAVEAYYNAIGRKLDVEKDRLYDKLDGSDKVINWANLFKK